MKNNQMRGGCVEVAGLIPSVLDSLGIPVEATEDIQRELHEGGTCEPLVCFLCYRERERRLDLMTLRGDLLRQVMEIEAELGIN
jgi:hypothetical protein